MTALYSDKGVSTVSARANVGLNAVVATATLTAALALNDTIDMVKMPAGATIVDMILYSTDLDTSTSLTYNLGDAGSAARFLSASTVGRAGGFVEISGMVAATLGYTFTAETTIVLTVAAAPTSTPITSGTIVLAVTYLVTN
jgi:hypothetical protein